MDAAPSPKPLLPPPKALCHQSYRQNLQPPIPKHSSPCLPHFITVFPPLLLCCCCTSCFSSFPLLSLARNPLLEDVEDEEDEEEEQEEEQESVVLLPHVGTVSGARASYPFSHCQGGGAVAEYPPYARVDGGDKEGYGSEKLVGGGGR
ncbi:MAG: hypothetical protein Q9177_006980, partial [Variospora cf. flavescens]